MSRAINTTIATTIERTPAVTAFLENVRKYPVLSEEEIVSLINKAKAGDSKAREQVVNSNLRFIFSLCNKFAQGDDILDLVSEASIGMIMAIDSFDATLGFKFLSYAVHYMRMMISEYFRTTLPMVQVSNSAKIGSKATKASEKFYQREMRMPSEEELIDMLEKEYGILIKNKKDVISVKMSSLSDKVDEDGETAENVGAIAMATADSNEYEKVEKEEYNKRAVNLFLSTLSVRDANIIKMLFGVCEWEGNAQTEESVAERYGIVPERVRQIKEKCLLSLNARRKKVMEAV